MPRIAEARRPAEPVSPEQKDRHRRILRAAVKHGAEKGLDRVQMHEVAKDAGVAIATLYRYFPSKTHLFTSLMAASVERLSKDVAATSPASRGADAVADLLIVACREMLTRPLLAHAMLQSNNASVADSGSAVTHDFADLILETLGVDEPDEEQARLVRIVEAAWYGVLISALNRHITPQQAEDDTRLACRLLLANF